MSKLRVLDLFSGISGFSLGLERTGGYQTVAFCEIDPYCRKVLAKHWPDVPCHDDVTTYPFQEDEADVVTAGFPCQDISFAGNGVGLAGTRSGLYREVIRAVRVVRPKFAVLENVAALLGRGLGTVLGDLAEIGYDAEWHCIPASAVGAPHRRDRIRIVAYPGSEQHQGGRAPLSGALAEELSAADAENGGCGTGRQGRPADGGAGQSKSQRAVSTVATGREAWNESCSRGWWRVEPDVGRVAHGVPNRVDRLKGLGNAVVPRIPELIGRAILASLP